MLRTSTILTLLVLIFGFPKFQIISQAVHRLIFQFIFSLSHQLYPNFRSPFLPPSCWAYLKTQIIPLKNGSDRPSTKKQNRLNFKISWWSQPLQHQDCKAYGISLALTLDYTHTADMSEFIGYSRVNRDIYLCFILLNFQWDHYPLLFFPSSYKLWSFFPELNWFRYRVRKCSHIFFDWISPFHSRLSIIFDCLILFPSFRHRKLILLKREAVMPNCTAIMAVYWSLVHLSSSGSVLEAENQIMRRYKERVYHQNA